MRYDIEKRVKQEAQHIINTGATVRTTARTFGFCKSTVHKDMTERLPKLNNTLYMAVKEVLDKNKSERSIRGGEENNWLKLSRSQEESTVTKED